MIYLIMAIVCTSLISVVMRVSEKHIRNRISMLAMNYVTCIMMAFAFNGSLQLLPEGVGRTLGLGLFNGALYLSSFMLLQWNIRCNGVTLSSTFMKLGVIVPTLMSMTLFRETPSVVQVLGLCAVVVAIVMINSGNKTQGRVGNSLGLVMLLFGSGFANSMSKVYEQVGDAALKNHFLLYTFMNAFLLCILVCVVKKQKIGWWEVLFGMLVGVPNYLSSRFLLLSLTDVPAVVAYPTFSVGSIVLVALAGVFIFREKLTRRQMLAMAVILVALVLLNV